MNMFTRILGVLGLLGGLASAAAAQVSYAPGPNNPNPSNESASGTNIPVLQIRVSVGGTENAIIQSLTIGVNGTLNDATGISAVNLYVDVNGNGWYDSGTDTVLATGRTYAADDGTITFGSLNRTIAMGGSELWLVTNDLSGSGSQGDQWTTHLGTSTTLSAVGATSGNALTVTGISVNSGAKKINTSNCTLSLYDWPLTQPSGPSAGQTAFPIAGVELRASTAATISITGVTFTASGTGHDVTEVARVRLFRDSNGDGVLTVGTDPEIGQSNVTYNTDNGTAPFTGLSESVPAGGRLSWIVAYDFASSLVAGSTFTLSIANASDLARSGHTHTGSTGSCQTHGIPTAHPTTTVPGTPPPSPTPTSQPHPRRMMPPQYCCPVMPPDAPGGGPGGPAALLLLWWPLLLLAALLATARRRAPAWRRA